MSVNKTLAAAALAFLCLAPMNAAAQPSGKVVDGATGTGIPNAVVMIKSGDNLLAHSRALTDALGNFEPSRFKSSAIDITGGERVDLVVKKAGYLPKILTDIPDAAAGNNLDLGTISLERDPLEKRIDSVMAMMNMAEKIGQMTQPELGSGAYPPAGSVTAANNGTNFLYGSVLNGGGGYSATFLNSMVNTLNTWPSGRARIPTSYGKDAVHGNAGVPGYTVFPHNIGLGATRDSALVRRIGEATAKELWAAGIDLNFSPAISVARDLRWGRTYESYGETAELSVQMGAAMVRGLQGERCNAPWRVTATAKHFLGDGGTTGGKDRGNTAATDEQLRAIHLPGYEAVVEQGVLSVMASFNTINNLHQHIDSVRMTVWLKTELGFDGYIISDWQGIANSNNPGFTEDYGVGSSNAPTLTLDAVRKAINAGIDLAMEPGATGSFTNQTANHTTFRNHLTALVNNGSVSEERVNDAVRRILRAKFRAGRMDNFSGPAGYVGNTANRASAEHRAIAREAVRKSQVLLKNENSILPLAKNASIHVFGAHHSDIGRQCGGWTIDWQGVTGNTNFSNIGTSIYQGMQQAAPQAALTSSSSSAATNAGVIVYVTGETPYAEWRGDITTLNFPSAQRVDSIANINYAADMAALGNYRSQGKKIVTIFVSGRPRAVPQLIEASDAFIAAWLPGTEGGGVADVLFGDHYITGKLPFAWPGSSGAQFAYGFGLTTAPNVSVRENNREIPQVKPDANAAAITPVNALSAEFTAGPNPIRRGSRLPPAVIFFRQGKRVENAALIIYDASGSFIRKVTIADRMEGVSPPAAMSANAQSRRQVGEWDLRNDKGRIVSEGTYLVKGVLKTTDGKTEKVSLILGIR